MTVVAIAYLLTVVVCVKLAPKEKPQKSLRLAERRGGRCGGVFVCAAVPGEHYVRLGHFRVGLEPEDHAKSLITAGFFANIQYLMVEKPEGYSAAQVEEVSEEVSQLEQPEPVGDPQELPTIIAVMNESFTDMAATSDGNITLSQDNLPFLHSLQESGEGVGRQHLQQRVRVPHREHHGFPALYQQYVDHEQTTDYECIAIHPGRPGQRLGAGPCLPVPGL